MDDPVKSARRQYAAEYREKNRERIREYQRSWRKNNPDNVKEIRRRFWEKKALEYSARDKKETT